MLRKNGVPTVRSFIFVLLTTRPTTLTETLDEHRERCHQEYIAKCGEDTCTSPTPERREEIEAWRADLNSWWTQHKVNQAQDTVRTGQRYKVMLDLCKELSEKVRRINLSLLFCSLSNIPSSIAGPIHVAVLPGRDDRCCCY